MDNLIDLSAMFHVIFFKEVLFVELVGTGSPFVPFCSYTTKSSVSISHGLGIVVDHLIPNLYDLINAN